MTAAMYSRLQREGARYGPEPARPAMGHSGLGLMVKGAQAVGADVLAADGLQAAVGAAVAQGQAAEGHVGGPTGFDDVPDVGVEHDDGVRRIHHDILLGGLFFATNSPL